MSTKEEIAAAYALVFESEKTKAKQYTALVNQFQEDLEKLAQGVPDNTNSALFSAIQQAKSYTTMYPGTTAHLSAVYGLNEEQTASADSTV